jgi:predicted nucleic acid-binding protein
MALTPGYLADKSAIVHLRKPVVAAKLIPLIMAGRISTCGVVELEVLYSARTERDLLETRTSRAQAYPRIAMSESDFGRVEDVLAMLAKKGHHRAVSLPDLLIAAVAERAGLTVLHYDADFEIVAAVTEQLVEWVAPQGSL